MNQFVSDWYPALAGVALNVAIIRHDDWLYGVALALSLYAITKGKRAL